MPANIAANRMRRLSALARLSLMDASLQSIPTGFKADRSHTGRVYEGISERGSLVGDKAKGSSQNILAHGALEIGERLEVRLRLTNAPFHKEADDQPARHFQDRVRCVDFPLRILPATDPLAQTSGFRFPSIDDLHLR